MNGEKGKELYRREKEKVGLSSNLNISGVKAEESMEEEGYDYEGKNCIPSSERKKKKEEDHVGKSPSSSSVDRISKLPDYIIHHILSFLNSPAEVTKTSILSKQWYRQIWASFPFLTLLRKDFDRGFPPGPRESSPLRHKKARGLKFREYVERTLWKYEINGFHINKFVIDTDIDMEDASWVSAVARWVKYLLQNHPIEEFNLTLESSFSDTRFDLPTSFFSTPKSLKSLTLAGCDISPTSCRIDQAVAFRHTLKRLKLGPVCFRFNDEAGVLNHVISACTLLEEIILQWCQGMYKLNIPPTLHKLRRVEVYVCYPPDSVANFDINSPSLEFFTFGFYVTHSRVTRGRGGVKMPWIKMGGCKNLKVLCLHTMAIQSSMLNAFMAQFPRLEELCLDNCDTIGTFTVSNTTLKTLRLKYLGFEVEIETPNLVSFKCTNKVHRTHPRIFSTTHDAVHRWRVKITIHRVYTDWFLRFREFLSVSKHFKRVDISIDFDKVKFKDLLCPISSLRTNYELLGHLSLVVSKLSSNYVVFLDALLRSCCPREVTLTLCDDQLGPRERHAGFVECLYNKVKHIGHTWSCIRDNCDGDCCAKDVEIEMSEEAGRGLNKNKRNKISELSALMDMLPTMKKMSSHRIHFRILSDLERQFNL